MKPAPASFAPRTREGPAPSTPAVFTVDRYRALEVDADGVPRLQAFLDANPEYHLLVTGEPPAAGEAATEFAARPPRGGHIPSAGCWRSSMETVPSSPSPT